MPYPSTADPQIKARMEMSAGYYEWLTALKLVQSYGRTVRSEEDYADTFIVDAQFKRFLGENRDLMPTWFLEAID